MPEQLPPLKAADFVEFFRELHGYEPFPWQRMLSDRVDADGWPDLIDLPTASGKTACIDIAIFALALQAGREPGMLTAARRIWFVVDRRIVVDEAHERAQHIAAKLKTPTNDILKRVAARLRHIAGTMKGVPLQIGRLRGGVPRDLAWNRNPAQPAVLTSTIDQFGSRLLFRGYGVSRRASPIHAALTGNDSLVLLDEAHLARPFLQTLSAVRSFRGGAFGPEAVPTPFSVVVMSATPPSDMPDLNIFPRPEDRAAALDHKLLKQRSAASKPTELAIAKKPKDLKAARPIGEAVSSDELVLDAARRGIDLVGTGRKRVAIMVNRVATARAIVAQLRNAFPVDDRGACEAEIVLLTGRLRPVDRDVVINKYKDRLKAGSREPVDPPIILVTTQCLEVGADFSFDALISECASLDALRQRFGRLDRLGDATLQPTPGTILIRKEDGKAEEKLDDGEPADPIYGNAMARTWNWLKATFGDATDFGINAFQPHMDALKLSGELHKLLAPSRDAPTLLPAYVDLWSQTNPPPAVDPDVALFLHGVPPSGERLRPEVRVLWRNELCWTFENPRQQADWGQKKLAVLEAIRPVSTEMLSTPLRELLDALEGAEATSEDDMEGAVEPDEQTQRRSQREPLGRSIFYARAGEWCETADPRRDLRHGDVVALPANDSSFRLLITNSPLSADVYELAARTAQGLPTIRFPAALGPEWRALPEDPEADPDDLPTARRLTDAVKSLASGDSEHDRRLRKTADDIWADEAGDPREGKPRRVEYAPGAWLVTVVSSSDDVGDWAFEPDADEEARSLHGASNDRPDERLLATHTARVTAAANHLAGRLLPETLVGEFALAARLHDVGKCDERFQSMLAGRQRIVAGDVGQSLLAKSGVRRTREQDRKLASIFQMPNGFRHEFLSGQLAETDGAVPAAHRDLILHLITSHHGFARPFAPVVDDDAPPDVDVMLDDRQFRLSSADRAARPAHALSSGVAERFWRLTRRYGWWGLAYFEAVLRCADTHASAYGAREAER